MSPLSPRAVAALLALPLLLAACGPQGALPPGEGEAADAARVPSAIAADVAAGKATRVLVLLDRSRLGAAPGEVELLLGAEAATDRVLSFATAKQDLFAGAPAGLEVVTDFEQLPLALAELGSPEALAHLVADPRVARLAPDTLNGTFLAQSLPLIAQPSAAAEGKDGTGTSIAILDTGADYRVADLGSCTGVGTPASCRVAHAQDFAVNDNLLDDSVRHGTNTASIAAAVAPGAKILALDVFDGQGAYTSTIISAINWVIANRGTYHIASMNLSLGGGSFTTTCDQDPMAVALAEARQVGVLAAVATGNSGTPNAISSPACATAAVSVGAVYDANVGAIGFSSCRETSTAANQVTCFSNAASFQTLVAPGALITAGGVTMAGTSQATPHVAGALAVLRAAFPAETPTELVTRLTSSGRPVTDLRTGRVVPRLDLAAAAAGCVLRLGPASATVPGSGGASAFTLTTSSGCAWTASSDAGWLTVAPGSGTGSATLTATAAFNGGTARTGTLGISVAGSSATASATVSQGVDTAPPTGTIAINGGATWSRSATVALALSASDPSGVAGMCVTNGTTCTTFEPFATARAWTLSATNGQQTVRVFLKDGRGNVSSAATAPSATIGLDTGLPTGGAVTAVPGNGQVALAWPAGTDATSGVAGYRVVYAAGAAAPASCATGTVAWEGSALTTTHQGLVNGTAYAYRVCALDRAGNLSPGAVATAQPRPESDGPVATLGINGGAAATTSTAVTLAIGASDASAVTQACFSTSATSCTAWEPYAASRAYTLTASQGLRTVYVRLKDVWGNASAAPASASILYDTVAPTGGGLTATPGDASATLAWTAASDATSGVAGYRVAFAAGTSAPASCAAGTLAGTPAASPFTVTGLTNGAPYAFRVCAVDRAGNVASGVTTSTMPKPEAAGPVGTVSINGGAATTSSPAVTLTLAATDASRVTSMCISTSATCTSWEPFAATRAYTLSATQGLRTVYASFRDEWGNPSTPASASITYDSAAPIGGTLAAAPGDTRVTLTWTASSDATSGVALYRVVYAAGTTAPASCAAGTLAGTPAASPLVVTGLTNGTTYGFRVCAVDRAGNVAAGLTATAMAKPETAGPVGSVTINGGAATTTTTTVALALAATDASRVTSMCVSSSATCTAWEPFAATRSFTLPATQGLRTVYATFRDEWGNASAPATAAITYDTVAPSGGGLVASPGDTRVTLTWTTPTDATSGVAGFRVAFAEGATAPASCAAGTLAGTPGTSPFTVTGLTNGTSYGFRVCAVDRAGNVAAGLTASTSPRPEVDGPVGRLTLDGGAAWSRTGVASASLSATDASGVTQMCLALTAACTVWVPFAPSATVNLGPSPGTRTVYAWFKDAWGNVSAAPATASIAVDTTLPTQPTLTATAGSRQVALSWTAATETGSGLAGYRLVVLPGTTLPAAACTTGTVLQASTALGFLHQGLVAGAAYAYRLCAVDVAGNVSAGAVVMARPLP